MTTALVYSLQKKRKKKKRLPNGGHSIFAHDFCFLRCSQVCRIQYFWRELTNRASPVAKQGQHFEVSKFHQTWDLDSTTSNQNHTIYDFWKKNTRKVLSSPSKCPTGVILVKNSINRPTLKVCEESGNLTVWADSWLSDSQRSHLSLEFFKASVRHRRGPGQINRKSYDGRDLTPIW